MAKVNEQAPNYWGFFCPACKTQHHFKTGAGQWTFNGDVERPTVLPSLLVQWKFGEQRERKICHSFITEGKIKYLADCTHPLAGQEVELPDLKDDR